MPKKASMQAVPAGAKKPQDHKPPKVVDAPEEFVVTVRGGQFVVPAEVLDDFELLDDLNVIEHGQANDGSRLVRMTSALRRLLPDRGDVSQWRAAMDLCRNDAGRVTIMDGSEFVAELMAALDPKSLRSQDSSETASTAAD